MRRSFIPPLVLLTVMTLAACGVRVDDSLRQQAAAAQLGGGGGGPVSADGTPLDGTEVDPVTGEPTTGDAGGDGTTGVAGAGGTGTSGAGGSAGSAAGDAGGGGGGGDGTAAAPAGGNGGATDVGVTANQITIGNVADLSGPVPGLFQGAVIGTQAYIAKINSEGGVFGRKLRLKVGDGQLDCGENRARHEALSKEVFAFVGSFSLNDDCGTDALAGKNVPDVHNALGQKTLQSKDNFSVQPLPPGWRTGPLQYFKKKFPDRWTKIGSIYANVGGASATWLKGTKPAIESTGGKVLYDRGFGPTDTDFTADIVRMRNDGVQLLYISASDAPTFARIVKAARQQDVDWPIIAGGIAYDEGFLKQVGSDGEGVLGDQLYSQFFNADDAAAIPAVKDFQTWTGRVAPGKKRDLFAAFGWASTQLFVEALKKAGPEAKRATIIAELKKVTTFDAGGLLAPSGPGNKQPPTCYVLNAVKGGKWVRVDTPPNAYRCDGEFFRA